MKPIVFLIKFFLIAFFLFTGIICWYIILTPIPDLQSFKHIHSSDSANIVDKNDILLYSVVEQTKKKTVSIEDIPLHTIQATIAIEDHLFYNHYGIRPKAILRALFSNIKNIGTIQGGSTITQQLIKNLLLTGEQHFTRKIKEMVLALKIEILMPKDKILELYFNTISYGGNTVGIAEGANLLFNKEVEILTLAESAYLASLPKSPSYLSPFGKNKSSLENRKTTVLLKMLEYGFIDNKQYQSASNEWVVFNKKNTSSIKAPHFVFFVQDELRKRNIDLDGAIVKTTLDYNLQKEVKQIIQESESLLKDMGVENMAAVILDSKKGDVLGMVGSKNYFDPSIDGKVNVITSPQQPGSAFKPFIYSAVFEKGFTPETTVFDVPTQFSTYCEPEDLETDIEKDCYAPKNYTETYNGLVSLRQSLAQSINIPTVKAAYLATLNTLDSIIKKVGLGEDIKDIHAHGLPIAIGSAETSPLNLANAYSIFANRGNFVPYKFLYSIEKNGKTISEQQSLSTQVISSQIADMVNDILVDDNARGNVFGRYSNGHTPLYFSNRSVAVKTGTTNQARDLWIVGYSQNIIIVLWAGNNNNTPAKEHASGSLLVPILHKIFELKNLTHYLKQPFNKYQKIFSEKDMIINEGRSEEKEYPYSSLYYIDKKNNLSEYWNYGILEWIKKNGYTYSKYNEQENGYIITILGADILKLDKDVYIGLLNKGKVIDRYEIYLDTLLIGVSHQPIFSFKSKTLGTKQLFVLGYTQDGNSLSGEKTITIIE